MQKDNSTYRLKVLLRNNLLKPVDNPVVIETHGGYGKIGDVCYSSVHDGVVFDKDERKTNTLAKKRPTWAVYEGDCVKALAGNAGNHLTVNFIDIDPYGEPWPVVDALFGSQREWPQVLGVAVNDGLRQKLKMNGGWSCNSLADVVSRYGNNSLYSNYLPICQEMLQEKAGELGYTLSRWAGYYCGYLQQMTHYAGLFIR